MGPEPVLAGSVVRSAYLKLRRTAPVGWVVEFRRRAAPGWLVNRSPEVPLVLEQRRVSPAPKQPLHHAATLSPRAGPTTAGLPRQPARWKTRSHSISITAQARSRGQDLPGRLGTDDSAEASRES